MQRNILPLLAALTLAPLTGCYGGGPVAGAEQQPSVERTVNELQISVVNDNWIDATVYVVDGTRRRLLGKVGSITTREFTYKPISSEIYFTVRLLAVRGEYVSPSILTSPGSTVVFRIFNSINLSTVTGR